MAFYKTTFSPGIYHIDVQYSGSNATTTFKIIDSDKIAIPPQYKIVAQSWSDGQTTDQVFAEQINSLIQYQIIKVSHTEIIYSLKIPSWLKNNAKWWSDGSISDSDFGLAIQYLINVKLMML